MFKNTVDIKNHYLVKTNPEYIFKFGVKYTKYPFIHSLTHIYDISEEEIINLIINKLKVDKDKTLYTSFSAKSDPLYNIRCLAIITYKVLGQKTV